MDPARVEPGPGQESVWDYPRPPLLEPADSRLVVQYAGVTIADTNAGYRVLETSQPPAFYLPPEDVNFDYLERTLSTTFCEWKGSASYYSIRVGDRVSPDAAWTYRDPTERFLVIKNYLAFYPQRVDACFVDDELVQSNDGSFYGGWITAKIVGPFKGGTGTAHW